MTPNGAVAFTLLVIVGALLARDIGGLLVILVASACFALASRRAIWSALGRSTGIVLPLVLFMMIVWVGIVGRAPHEIAANLEGSRSAAAIHVAIICLRLFVIAFTVQIAFLHFAGWTPLRFIGALALPRVAKKLLVLTLSLIGTILQAVDRARTALIGAGLVTRQRSWRNLRHGWILVQTVWLTVITIVLGRTRDKWPVEDTLARLEATLAARATARLTAADFGWMALAVAAGSAGLRLWS
jgi:F0F1-type ATP synthase assembly protein I